MEWLTDGRGGKENWEEENQEPYALMDRCYDLENGTPLGYFKGRRAWVNHF